MEQTPNAVELKGISRLLGNTRAVDGLDLTVKRGEMFGLVGPDGSGKTTAIRMVCGILLPTGGSGTVLGIDLATGAEKIKTRIGYLSQDFTLYGDLTIDENLEFFAEIHGVTDYHERRNKLLDFTRLTPFRKRLAYALSGGMKKKLALACTLIHKPELLLLDEPSTGVDPVSRGEFWSILSSLLEDGVTILMTTPYLDEAERCSRIGLMHRGKLLMAGSPEAIKAAMPGSIFTISCPRPAAAHGLLRNTFPPSRLVLYGDRLHLQTAGSDDEARTATATLDSAGLGPCRYERVAPSLEDAFVALVSQKDASMNPEN